MPLIGDSFPRIHDSLLKGSFLNSDVLHEELETKHKKWRSFCNEKKISVHFIQP